MPEVRETLCLLHGKRHEMAADCWEVTADWYFANPDGSDTERRAAYIAAVEEKAASK